MHSGVLYAGVGGKADYATADNGSARRSEPGFSWRSGDAGLGTTANQSGAQSGAGGREAARKEKRTDGQRLGSHREKADLLRGPSEEDRTVMANETRCGDGLVGRPTRRLTAQSAKAEAERRFADIADGGP